MGSKRYIIQKEISISQKEMDGVIADMEKMSDKMCLMTGGWSGKKKDMIREVKKISKIGKQILLMKYQYKKWIKKQKLTGGKG